MHAGSPAVPKLQVLVEVACYSGYKSEERPVRFCLGDQFFAVVAVEDRWYSPGASYFRVVVPGGDHYVLRHDEGQDRWTLEGFRSAKLRTPSPDR